MWAGIDTLSPKEIRRRQARRIDPAWLSEAIGDIYDCALDPGKWPSVFEKLGAELDFGAAMLGLIQTRPAFHAQTIGFGIDEEWTARADSYSGDMTQIWGGAALLQSYPLDEPLLASSQTDAAAVETYSYYRDILKPRGVADSVGIGIARQQHLIGYLAFTRFDWGGPVGQREITALRLLAPHMRRAVTIGDLFDMQAIEKTAARSVIDGLGTPVLLVDAAMRIVHANPVAEALLSSGSLLNLAKGQLSLRGQIANDALRTAIRIAGEDEARMSQRGIGIPAQDSNGQPAVLHVLPLQRGSVRAGIAQRAVAAVFVVTGEVNHTPVDAIAAIYDFTPAETQIFAMLSEGRTMASTAEALGIAQSTAKTHLLRIFAKTGCKRQAELVALAARLTAAI